MVDKKKNKGTLKKVFSYIGKYKYFLILSMFFAAVTVGLTLYAPILVGKAIDCIIGKGNVDFVNMKSILIKVAVIVVSTALIQWLMNVCNNKITYNVSRDLRKKAFEKIEILPFSYIDTHSKGDIVSRVITDVDQLSDGLLMGFTQFFTGVITIIGTLAFMLSVNVFITIVVVVVTPLSFFIARFIAKKTFNMFSLQSKTRGEQTSFIDEMISNQKVAEAYSMNEENKARFDKINDDLAKYSLKATFFSSITNPATRFVNGIVYAAVALFGAIMAVKELRNYIENGNIVNSVNYPACDMGVCTSAGRVAVCHKNVPAIISKITSVMGDESINIEEMANKSRGDYAYSMLDISESASETVVDKLASIEGVIKVRVIK